jgi:hypothetical protein
MAAERKIMRQVVRTVRVSTFFVHCYLACGHMVTMHKEDPAPSSIECWACEEESKKGLSPK